MGDYLRRCLEMANLPIPAEMQQQQQQSEAAAKKEEDAQAKKEAAQAKAAQAKAAQAAKRPQQAAAQLAAVVQQPPQPLALAVVPQAAAPAGLDGAALAVPQMALAMPQQQLLPVDPMAGGGFGAAGLGAASPEAYAAMAAGYGQMCGDPSAGFGGLVGMPADASAAVLQLQYARYAAAMQFQTAYAVGGAAMLNNAANPGQSAAGNFEAQVSAFNMASAAAAAGGGGAGGCGVGMGDRPRPRPSNRQPREPHDPERRFIGTITKWDDDAGFGFISSWDAYKVYGKDVFVHKAQIGLIGGASAMYAKRRRSEIRNGDTVSYTVDLAENPGKPRAYNVEKLAAPPEGPAVSGEAELAKRRRLEAGGKP